MKDGLALALGAIGDAFTGQPNTANFITGSFAQRRQAEQQAKQFQAQRAAELEDYRTKKGIDQQYATPAHNDTVADYEFIASKLGQEAANQYLSGMGDPIVTVPLPGGQI
jgi:hypothetical protein